MMTTILGNDVEKTVDEYIVGFITTIFPLTVKPLITFNYAHFLADNIHFQLLDFKANNTLKRRLNMK
jgi:hypothetical protein